MVDDLSEIYERLAYAEEEIATVERHLGHFLQTHVELKPDPKPDVTVWLVRCKEPIPTRIRSRVGGTVHEIRACLDELACRLAERNGSENVKRVYFPITKTADYFATDAAEKLKKLSPADRATIYALEPHGDANPFLFGMHELDRIRKHQRLTLNRIANPAMGIREGHISKMTYYGAPVVEAQWTTLLTVEEGTEFRGGLVLRAEFVEPEQLKGEEVVHALKRFLQEVRSIVDKFN